MEFGLAIISNLGISQNDAIQELSDEMASFLEAKDYGSGLKSYTIGVVCVEPIYEQFFKEKRPKYVKGKRTIVQEGFPFTLDDSFEYQLKLDYEKTKGLDSIDVKKVLSQEILNTFVILDSMKTKFRSFNAEQFKDDVRAFFLKEGLLVISK